MIIQGDNGTRLRLFIKEEGIPLDLNGATVEIKIKRSDTTITKTGAIIGTGECEVELTSDDVIIAGKYFIQLTIKYNNGDIYSSNVQQFNVDDKL